MALPMHCYFRTASFRRKRKTNSHTIEKTSSFSPLLRYYFFNNTNGDVAMQYEDEVRERISMLRFLMIFGVVLLHTPPFVPIKEVGGGTFDLLKSFFQNAVFRTTVPVLT